MICAETRPLLELRPLELLSSDESQAVAAHLTGCDACRAEGEALQDAYGDLGDLICAELAPLPEGLREQVVTAEPDTALQLRVRLSCTYCHDGLVRELSVFCAGCLAPHHEECFRRHGACSALGCPETRTVRPADLPITRSRWRAPLALAASALLAGGLVILSRAQIERPTGQDPQVPDRTQPEQPRRARQRQQPEQRQQRQHASRLVRRALATFEVARNAGSLEAAVKDLDVALGLGTELEGKNRQDLERELAQGAFPSSLVQGWLRRAEDDLQSGAVGPRDAIAKAGLLGESPLTDAQRVKVKELIRKAERVIEDGARWSRAMKVIAARDPAKYPQAVKLLEEIERSSPLYADAQGYLAWIDADVQARAAKRAYDNGQTQVALMGLDVALRSPGVVGSARHELQQRRTRWKRVARSFSRGVSLWKVGRARQAQAFFQEVVKLEPNKANWFHRQARDYLSRDSYRIDGELKRGILELKRKAWGKAGRHFSRLRTHKKQTLARATVAAVARNERLLALAERNVREDRTERFLEMRDLCQLLATWLPKDDPAQAKAKRLLAVITKRLKRWKK